MLCPFYFLRFIFINLIILFFIETEAFVSNLLDIYKFSVATSRSYLILIIKALDFLEEFNQLISFDVKFLFSFLNSME